MSRIRFSAARVRRVINSLCRVSPEFLPTFNPRLHLAEYLDNSKARLNLFQSSFQGLPYQVQVDTFTHKDAQTKGGGQAGNCLVLPKGGIVPGTVLLVGHHDYCAGRGAEDNATALGTMVELARVFNGFPRLAFGSFDLEEVGCVGSHHYVDSLADSYLRQFEYVIALECLGSGKDLVISDRMGKIVSDPHLVASFQEASRSRVTGRQFLVNSFEHFYADHFPFAERGSKAVLLGSLDLAAWLAMSPADLRQQIIDVQSGLPRRDGSVAHTRFDLPANIKTDNLAKAGRTLVRLIDKLAS